MSKKRREKPEINKQEVMKDADKKETQEGQSASNDNSEVMDDVYEDELVENTDEKPSELDDYWGNKYSVFDYFKNHTTLLIAVISGFAALYTFCAYISDYSIKTYELEQLGLSKSLYHPDEKSLLITFILSCIPLVIYGILFFVYFYVLRSYYINVQALKYDDIQMSDKRRKLNKDNKSISRIKRNAKKDQKLIKTYHNKGALAPKELVDNIHKVTELLSRIDEHDLQFKEADRKVRKAKRKYKRLLFRASGFVELIFPTALCWVYVLVNCRNSTLSNYINAPLLSTTFVLLIIVSAIIGAKVLSCVSINKKRILADKNGELYKKLHKQDVRFSFLTELMRKGVRQFLPNSILILIVLEIFFAVSLLTFIPSGIIAIYNTFSLPSKLMASRPKASLVYIDDSIYAIVYQDGTQFYLEEATLGEDNTLVINTDKKLFLNASELQAETVTFDHIFIHKGE